MPPCISISYFNITENSCCQEQQNVTNFHLQVAVLFLGNLCVLYTEKYVHIAVCYFQITINSTLLLCPEF